MTVMTSEDLIREALLTPKEKNINGVRLTVGKAKTVDFADLDTKRKYKRVLPENIDAWTIGNFVSFAKKLFIARYGKEWDLNFSSQCQEVQRIRDSLIDIKGYVDNVMLRDYIQWFFENCADGFLLRAKAFYFSQLRQDWVLKRFIEGYRFNPNVLQKPAVQKTVEDNIFDEEKMSCTYLLSDEDFVSQYGLILSVCWLVSRRSFNLKDALKLVYQACCKLDKKHQFVKVKEATERYNPYPVNALFLQADRLAKKINTIYSVNVETSENALASLRWLTSK